MSKKRVFILAILVCCLAVATTASFALFTASETAHNVITTGRVSIQVQELIYSGDGEPLGSSGPLSVMPGSEISRTVKVKNGGDAPAWIRLKVEKTITLAGDATEPDLSLITLDLNTAAWTEKDGYFYYNSRLEPGQTTAPLFTTITFAGPGMGNKYQNSVASVSVRGDAVQTANNGASVLDAAGWPAA